MSERRFRPRTSWARSALLNVSLLPGSCRDSSFFTAFPRLRVRQNTFAGILVHSHQNVKRVCIALYPRRTPHFVAETSAGNRRANALDLINTGHHGPTCGHHVADQAHFATPWKACRYGLMSG